MSAQCFVLIWDGYYFTGWCPGATSALAPHYSVNPEKEQVI